MRRSRPGRRLFAVARVAAGLTGTRGMTFVEVLVVTSLLALVVGALAPVLTASEQTWRHAHRRIEMVQNARLAMDHLMDRLRAVQTFTTISSTNISFTYFYGDGVTTLTAEYRLNGNELEWKYDVNAFAPLAGPFRSMSVSCFDATAAAVSCTSAASVRSVQVSLVAMDPSGEVADITVTGRAFRQVP